MLILADEYNPPLDGDENIREFEGISIDSVSDLSINGFTQLFSQPNQCFETIPIGDW